MELVQNILPYLPIDEIKNFSINSNTQLLDVVMLLDKSYVERVVIKHFLYTRFRISYLGLYLYYLLVKDTEENKELLDEIILELTKDKDELFGSFYAFILFVTPDKRNVDIIVYTINLVRKIADKNDREIILDDISSIQDYLIDKSKYLLKEVYDKLDFQIKPTEIIGKIIEYNPYEELAEILIFLIDYYIDKGILTFNEINELFRSKGSNGAKLWLDEVILNQV